MGVDPIVPDRALELPFATNVPPPDAANTFAQLVDAAGGALSKADAAEAAFTRGKGGLQEMVIERARADITLAVATTGAQRAAQALNTILGMQI